MLQETLCSFVEAVFFTAVLESTSEQIFSRTKTSTVPSPRLHGTGGNGGTGGI